VFSVIQKRIFFLNTYIIYMNLRLQIWWDIVGFRPVAFSSNVLSVRFELRKLEGMDSAPGPFLRR